MAAFRTWISLLWVNIVGQVSLDDQWTIRQVSIRCDTYSEYYRRISHESCPVFRRIWDNLPFILPALEVGPNWSEQLGNIERYVQCIKRHHFKLERFKSRDLDSAIINLKNNFNFRVNCQCNWKVDMVPKECGFNQSETVHCLCLLTTARDGELIQMQHSCHQTQFAIQTHECYITTKRLYVDATIIGSFRSCFHVSYHRRMPGSLAWQR